MLEEGLVTASQLEKRNILRRTTAYKMARRGQIPSYAIGPKGRGIRFCVSEVLEALRRTISDEKPR